MGCDIHGYIETRRYSLKSETKWRLRNKFTLCPYWELGDCIETKFDCIKSFSDRNYLAFYMLAGVRDNGSFKVEPFSEPRGIPLNVNSYISSEVSEWGYDAHSHSYITLMELREYRSNYQKVINESISLNLKELEDEMSVYLNGELKEDNIRFVFWFDN